MTDDSNQNDRTRTHVVLAKGTMVSHYRIIEKIGAGGMGEVYLALDTKLSRRVALKFLPLQLVADSDAKARFTREAQAAASLSHANIAHVYEVSQFHGRPFFAMELVEGQSLRNIVKQGDIPLDKIIDYAIQICDGLQEAHAVGIVHRDVKPANIILSKRGRPKIVDFGLAAIRGTEKLTQTGSTLGTVGYMSPEQVQGREVDHRSDLFAFGVVLYELITGKRPFEGENDAATMNAITTQSPQPLARYRADVPDDLQRIVTKLLEKDPQLRYQRAEGVIPDLKRLIATSTSYIAPAAPKPRSSKVLVGAIILLLVVIAAGAAYKLLVPERREVSKGKKMLVVLPFENLGHPDDEYFAAGITDEITSRLAKLSGLGVIARTSAVRYKDTDKDLPQIAEELGVGFVLEGTIRWDKSGDTDYVRITPQLIRVSDNTHLWAENYERPLTRIFAVQAEIASRIVEALDVSLIEPERRSLEAKPTENLQAYDYYLRGREYWHRFEGNVGLLKGLEILERAVALDSTFADANAEISTIHSFLYWTGYDRSQERLDAAWQTATKARQYDSLDSYSRLALGYYYYYGSRDYERALEHFEHALRGSPNSGDVWAGIGYVKRRMGRWQESLEAQKRALELDPLSTTIRSDVSHTARRMRRYDEALSIAERGLTLFPNHPKLLGEKTLMYLHTEADPNTALAALDSVPHRERVQGDIAYARLYCYVFSRQYDSALVVAQQLKDVVFSPDDTASSYYWLGQIYRLRGETEKSRLWLDSARVYIGSLHERGFLKGGAPPPPLGPVLAGLGRPDEAIAAAREEVSTLSLSVDALLGANRLKGLALTYTMVGEHEAAIELLDTLLSIPSEITVPWLRHHPLWDPLRDHPRFKALLEKYGESQ